MTTGRINQVAFLADADARTTRRAGSRRARQSFASRDIRKAWTERGRGPTPTRNVPHPRERAGTPRAWTASQRSARHAGNAKPASSPPRTPEGARRMGATKPSNSISWVSNTGYRTHPQARGGAWGKHEADGEPTVRCTSTEPASRRHPITTHTSVALTRRRPGQTNHNP